MNFKNKIKGAKEKQANSYNQRNYRNFRLLNNKTKSELN